MFDLPDVPTETEVNKQKTYNYNLGNAVFEVKCSLNV